MYWPSHNVIADLYCHTNHTCNLRENIESAGELTVYSVADIQRPISFLKNKFKEEF